MATGATFVRCYRCSYNFLTGQGRRNCNWHDCPYLSEDLKVRCPRCEYNLFTGEGVPHCGDPPVCEWAATRQRRLAEAVRAFRGSAA